MKTKIASLGYSFRHGINPYASLLEPQAHEWIDSFSCFTDTVKDKCKKSKLEVLAAYGFPNVNFEKLIPITRCIMIGFFFDDFCNSLSLNDMKSVCQKVIETLNGDYFPNQDDNDFFKQYAILRSELLQIVPSYWMKRFIKHHQDWFNGLIEEYRYNNANPICYPSLKDYKVLREKVFGSGIICDMLEIETGFIIPREIFLHPVIIRLRQLVCLLGAWFNDIHTVTWELEKKETMNLVLVIQNERECTLEDAYDEAVKIHNNDLAELMEIRENLPDFGRYNKKLKEYFDNVELSLKGHEIWYLQATERYRQISS